MCLALGIDDPEFWYQNTDPNVLTGWLAYYELEPWGEPWRQTSLVAHELSYLTAMIVSTSGTGIEPPPINPPSSYMPVKMDDAADAMRPGKRWLSAEESQQQFIVGFGFG